MAKYKGKDLSLLIDTEEVAIEGISAVLDNEEGETDSQTFRDLQEGAGRQFFFTISAVSDYGSGSFWSLCWDNNGEEVAFVFKPYGNAVASVSQPHWTGECKVTAPPPIGGTAGTTFTFETRFDVIGKPVRVTAAA